MEQAENITGLIWTIYSIILLYFILGGISFYLINRRRPPDVAKKNYLKYFTYFIIINILFYSITLFTGSFQYLTLGIIGVGLNELLRLFLRSDFQFKSFFILSVIIYLIISVGFFMYSQMDYKIVLYVFLIASIFDSFSQITGQLWGKQKILPRISPNKTIGGVLGGGAVAVLSGFLLASLYETTVINRLLFSLGVVLFAFIGDIMASLYKRKYRAKDYSQLIPGHGGVLDRFDSLIACGAWTAFYFWIL